MLLLTIIQYFTTFYTVLRYTVSLKYLMLNFLLCFPLNFKFLYLILNTLPP